MKQYWTPLAKILGLAAPGTEAALAAAPAAGPAPGAASSAATSWPVLFAAARAQALNHWLPAHRRHAEVSPDELLSLRRLCIQAPTPALNQPLLEWQAEAGGQAGPLLQWLIQGPWCLPEIQQVMDFSALDGLTCLPAPLPPLEPAPLPPAELAVSKYERPAVTEATQAAEAAPATYVISADWMWVKRPPVAAASAGPLPPFELRITDLQGERSLRPSQRWLVLGMEKTVQLPNGESLVLQDQQPLQWRGEEACFIAVQGTHVSGQHLVLRVQVQGIDYQDLGSTNGTYAAQRPVPALVWQPVASSALLYLGGPPADARVDAPSVLIQRCDPGGARSLQATPLRQSQTPAGPATPPLLRLHCAQGQGLPSVVLVFQLPFVIGRDLDCDWVIPAAHQMVSRKHLILEDIDLPGKALRVRDISSNRLTQHDGASMGDASGTAVVPFGSSLRLGNTLHQPGFSFTVTN